MPSAKDSSRTESLGGPMVFNCSKGQKEGRRHAGKRKRFRRLAPAVDVYSHLLPGMQEEAASKVDTGRRAALDKQRRPVA